MRRFLRTLAISLAAMLALAGSGAMHLLQAQCADGTPPPCEIQQPRPTVNVVEPPPMVERARRFLVLPFRNVTRSAEAEWLVEGSPTLLSDALAQWEDLYVVPPERLYPVLERHGLVPGGVMGEDAVRKVAEETGGWTAVTGDILATGNTIRLSARVYDVPSGEVVMRAREEVEAGTDIREAYDKLSAQLLEVAGLEVEGSSLAGVTTQSLEAYKAYQRGMSHYNHGELALARDEFQEAIELDSSFAQAYLKLAEASVTSVESLSNPQSAVYRYAEKALQLSSKLPARDREFVQSVTDLFRGQISASRERLERLLAEDSADVEVLTNLADLETFDPILVERDGEVRPRVNHNAGARYAKQVLALDPQRHSMYMVLASIYSLAGGVRLGRVTGIRGEQPSLMNLFQRMSRPDTVFILLLRDSLELLPIDSVEALPENTVEAARERATDIAVAWVDRWLAAAPDEGVAHMMAASVFMLDGQYDRALERAATAESLGVEVAFLSNYAGKRIEILSRAGRYAEAEEVADSLKSAGYFSGAPYAMNNVAQFDAARAFNVYLARGRLAAAESLVTGLLGPITQLSPLDSLRALRGILTVFGLRASLNSPPLLPVQPNELHDAALDTLMAKVSQLPDSSLLRARLGTVLRLGYNDMSEERGRDVATRVRDLAAEMIKQEEHDLGLQMLMGIEDLDSSEMALNATFDLYAQLAEREPSDLRAHYRLGRLAAIHGFRLDEGAEALETYLAQPQPSDGPEHYAAHWRLGMIEEKRGNVDRAQEHYEKALELNPNYRPAQRGLERLEEAEQ